MTFSDDYDIVYAQLGREPRGMVCVAASAKDNDPLGVPAGEPLVVQTAPRVDARRSVSKLDGAKEPFPTMYYLTNPLYTAALSRLEADGLMKELEARITPGSDTFDENLAKEYAGDHMRYIKQRDNLALELGLEPLTKTHADISAGGMPNRVKCLHALVGQALADSNAIGNIVLDML